MKQGEYELCKRLINLIKEHPNPYPKDIFLWNNKESLDFNRGRFNKFIFQVAENTKEDIINLIKEEMQGGD